MSFFDTPTVEILDPDTLAVLGTITSATDIRGGPVMDGIAQGSFRVHYFAPDVSFIQRGRIAYCYTQSSLSANVFELATFIIDEIKVDVGLPLMYEISGPSLMGELLERHIGENVIADITSTTLSFTFSNKEVFTTLSSGASSGAGSISVTSATDFAIGQAVTVALTSGTDFSTIITNVSGTTISLQDTLSGAAASGNAVSTHTGTVYGTLASNASAGASSVVVANATGFVKGQPVSIALDAGGRHSTIISNVSGTTLSLEDDLPSAAASGNEIETDRGHVIIIASAINFAVGQPVFVSLDDGTTHTSGITYLTGTTLAMADQLPEGSTATSGNTVTTHQKATNDIEQIMAYAPATWAVPATNTPDGSYLVGKGETVYQALEQARQQGGGHFRLSTTPKTRDIEWLSTPADSGIDLVMPDTSTHADMTSATKGILLGLEQEDARDWPLVTRVQARGANGLTFTDAEDYVTPPAGYTVNWVTGTITNDTLEATFSRKDRYIVFGHVEPVHESTAANVLAAINLYEVALNWLQNQSSPPRFFNARCIVHDNLHPFDYVNISYSQTQGLSNFAIGSGGQRIIHEVSYSVRDDGLVETSLRLGDDATWRPKNDADAVAATFRDIDTKLRHISGGGSGAISGGTIVNVTGGNGITVLNSVVSVKLATPSGLSFASGGGLQIDDSVAGNGLTIASKILAVGTPGSITSTSTNATTADSHTHAIDSTIVTTARTVTAGAGLTGGGALSANITINVGDGDGLVVNADDVALGMPGSVTSTSTNSVTASSHTHAVDSTIALSAVTLTAGSGLTGGGNLTTNRTFNVGAGLGITVNADDVALTTPGTITTSSTNSSSGNHTHALDAAITAQLHDAVTLATDANTVLGLTGQQLTLDTQTANTVWAGPTTGSAADPTFRSLVTADLPTGQTLSVSSSNSGTSHAITTSSAVSTATETILATDSNGRLQVRGMGIGVAANANNAVRLPNAGWLGLGSSAGRITFTDTTIDEVTVDSANFFATADAVLGHSALVTITGVSNRQVQVRGSGPLISIVDSDDDDRPCFQIEAQGGHDSVALAWDAYWNGSNWISGSSNSSYRWSKVGNLISLDYGSATAGSTISTWSSVLNVLARRTLLNDSASGFNTAGLTINQLGEDDELITGKSSDVTHTATADAEGDTYFTTSRVSVTNGGVRLRGYSSATVAAELTGVGTTDNTTKSASGSAYTELRGGKITSNALGNAGSNANIVAIRNNISTVWIVDAEGDTHRDGTDSSFDEYEDAHLARMFDRIVSPSNVVDDEFDSWVKYGRDDLIRAGILHESGFYNESRLLRLAIGSVWQGYKRQMKLEERIESLEKRLITV